MERALLAFLYFVIFRTSPRNNAFHCKWLACTCRVQSLSVHIQSFTPHCTPYRRRTVTRRFRGLFAYEHNATLSGRSSNAVERFSQNANYRKARSSNAFKWNLLLPLNICIDYKPVHYALTKYMYRDFDKF